MFYRDGTLARLGDRVRISETQGVIVLSIDTDEYTAEFTREEWADILVKGVMIDFEKWGLIHYVDVDEDLEFLSRANGAIT